MQHILFELLENSGFLRGTTVNTDRIARARQLELIEVALQSAELTPTASVTNASSIFSHTASLSLSGDVRPCACMDCRSKHARELAQFAAFYSDRVFINNGLFMFARGHQDSSADEARWAFQDELEVIATLRPLIEAGLILPITPTVTKCFHCLGRGALPNSEQERFDLALRRFTRRFAAETEVAIERYEDDSLSLHMTGSNVLLEGGRALMTWGNIGELARTQPQLANRLRVGQQVPVSRALRKKWAVDAARAHDLFDDIGFEMAVSQCLKTSVVTSRPVHVEILNDFVRSTELNRRNTLIQRHLTCIVPFLNDISTCELLELRKGEGDAFVSFRQAFAKAVDEHTKAKVGNLTEQDADAIFKEVIEPELARLNRKVTSASKSVFRKSRAGVLGWAAALSVGFYFGFVESSLIAAAKALGLTKVAADLTAGLIGSSGEDAIRDENMYFLWKVRHRSQRS